MRPLLLCAALGVLSVSSCTCATIDTTGAGGGSACEPAAPVAGDVCNDPSPAQIKIRFEPSYAVVPPCADPSSASCTRRSVKVIVDPDFCQPTPVTFQSSDAAVAAAPETGSVTLYEGEIALDVVGGKAPGTATITARIPKQAESCGEGATEFAEATLTVDVLEADPATLTSCDTADNASKAPLGAGETLAGGGALASATIAIPAGADAPEKGSFLWRVEPFDASIACAPSMTIAGMTALGPAITFGPEAASFQRELPLSIPLNPAALPAKARWRHLKIGYSGPGFKEPRVVPVADARVEKVGGQWAVTFKAPRLGTYQAFVRADAGTKATKRRLTHRAVIGVSMGGGGTAMFGMRHHDLFDVLAPLGGPVDWTWLAWYIEQNHLGGFRPIAPGTQLADIQLTTTPCVDGSECKPDETCLGVIASPMTPGSCTLLQKPIDPYEHAQAFNKWWIEYPRTGTGGSFPRDEYAQIFRDLALMFGNPNGENLTKGGENLPAGVRPDDPSQLGDHPNGECSVWVDPLGGHPDEEKQKEIAQNCPHERCAHTLTLQNYFDDEYNPDGTFPVITVCDGSPQNEALSPYANTWAPGGQYPLEVGLAVDYNGNGVRDELEPLIRAGHERFDDVGVDGVPSTLEPGYVAGVNDDPAGDDYNPQYNPAGTENDHRWQRGEPFDDTGLDGVAGTAQQPAYPVGWQQAGDGYDVGEGDGELTVSRGLAEFWDRDPHTIVRRFAPVGGEGVPGGELDDAALSRLDVWTDGGTRDLFNFHVDAQHFVGAFAARGRDVAYFTDFTHHPGLDPSQPDQYLPPRTVYEDMQGVVMQRYGKIDPTPDDIDKGSGQHVGTANELVNRLQSAFFFIGSRWPEPELRAQVAKSADDPVEGASQCEIIGNCTIEFTSSFGRKGPVGITLPPGYAHKDQQWRRYPVVFVLHGYGQTPEDLEASIVLVHNWMNSPIDGIASRLPKAILVYVDGRCRIGENGKAECIRGTFFTDSVREEGVLDESWWLELIDYVDQNYRTMGESVVDWTE